MAIYIHTYIYRYVQLIYYVWNICICFHIYVHTHVHICICVSIYICIWKCLMYKMYVNIFVCVKEVKQNIYFIYTYLALCLYNIKFRFLKLLYFYFYFMIVHKKIKIKGRWTKGGVNGRKRGGRKFGWRMMEEG